MVGRGGGGGGPDDSAAAIRLHNRLEITRRTMESRKKAQGSEHQESRQALTPVGAAVGSDNSNSKHHMTSAHTCFSPVSSAALSCPAARTSHVRAPAWGRLAPERADGGGEATLAEGGPGGAFGVARPGTMRFARKMRCSLIQLVAVPGTLKSSWVVVVSGGASGEGRNMVTRAVHLGGSAGVALLEAKRCLR